MTQWLFGYVNLAISHILMEILMVCFKVPTGSQLDPNGVRTGSLNPRSVPGLTSDFLSAVPSDTAVPPGLNRETTHSTHSPWTVLVCCAHCRKFTDFTQSAASGCQLCFFFFQAAHFLIEPHIGYVRPSTPPKSNSLTTFFHVFPQSNGYKLGINPPFLDCHVEV